MTFKVQDFLELLANDGGGGGGGNASLPTAVLNSIDPGSATLVAPAIAPTIVTPAESLVPSTSTISTGSTTIEVNFQILPEGFGSYLQDILPNDIAAAAGAFSATMQQIKNIRKINIEKFAQVVASLETTANLPLVNGTNVPADTTEAKAALALVALGSGPHGTYTFSDFFGCMSGLPYPWKDIQPAIIGLQSNTLATIYQNLYLALSWKQATATVTMTSSNYTLSSVLVSPGIYNYYYQIDSIGGVGSFDHGGGYGRDGAVAPTATIDGGSGATLITTIDTTPAVNNGTTTFGTVLSALLGSHGTTVNYDTGSSPTPSTPPATLTVTIDPPPALTPDLNTVVQAYIDAANAEIAIIRTTHPGQSVDLNDMWDNLGTQLGIEQAARNLGLSPLPAPRVGDLFPYPTMLYSFTDLLPNYSKLTEPNLSAQTLEAISNLTLVAGQSIVAAMRSDRNKARLIEAGITQDDNIPDTLPEGETIELITNGAVGNSAPAYPFDVTPVGTYNPVTENYVTPAGVIIGAPETSVAAVLGIGTPDNLPIPSPDIGIGTPGISAVAIPEGEAPFFTGPGAGGGAGSQGGGPIVPGSLAGSPFTKLIPPALNPVYTSGTLLPAALTVAQAIEQVITCNCDCWVQ